DPQHTQQLREEMARLEAEQRGDANLNRLREQIRRLEQQIDQGNERLAVLPPDRLPGLIGKLREWEGQRNALRGELQRCESESPVARLEEVIAAAEKALWRLREALQAEDRTLLREVIRELIARVELHWKHEARGKLTRARLEWGAIVPSGS